MKDFKGTREDWSVHEYENQGVKGIEIQFGNDGECITDHVYNIHDAKLIAAAPELLTELISIMEACKGNAKVAEGLDKKAYTEIYEAAEQAIKKAL